MFNKIKNERLRIALGRVWVLSVIFFIIFGTIALMFWAVSDAKKSEQIYQLIRYDEEYEVYVLVEDEWYYQGSEELIGQEDYIGDFLVYNTITPKYSKEHIYVTYNVKVGVYHKNGELYAETGKIGYTIEVFKNLLKPDGRTFIERKEVINESE